MDDTQLMKGILEGCILSVISRREAYGYEIMQVLADAGFDSLQEGTLYPILTRLEKKGYIACRKEKSPMGPIRKYFSITDLGTNQLDAFRDSYRSIIQHAGQLLFSEEEGREE